MRHLIETLGVPHTEVELILVNGHSVGLDHRIEPGDRVSVYPVFESLDVTPLLRLRPRPLRDPRFLADAHLGRLARYLRMLGFDTRLEKTGEDATLARTAAREERILLTRDRALLMHRVLTHGCYLRARLPREQLLELLARLDLCRLMRPFTRCMACNGCLRPVAGASIRERLPADTRRRFHSFRECSDCHKIYWKGSHYSRMQGFIEALKRDLERLGRGCGQ